MLTSAYVRIKNSAFTLNLWYLVTNTFPHLQRGTHSSISTSQVAIFSPLFAANCVFSRVCKFFGVVFCGCIGLNSYLGGKRLTRSSVSRCLRFALHNTICIILLSYVNLLLFLKENKEINSYVDV